MSDHEHNLVTSFNRLRFMQNVIVIYGGGNCENASGVLCVSYCLIPPYFLTECCKRDDKIKVAFVVGVCYFNG